MCKLFFVFVAAARRDQPYCVYLVSDREQAIFTVVFVECELSTQPRIATIQTISVTLGLQAL